MGDLTISVQPDRASILAAFGSAHFCSKFAFDRYVRIVFCAFPSVISGNFRLVHTGKSCYLFPNCVAEERYQVCHNNAFDFWNAPFRLWIWVIVGCVQSLENCAVLEKFPRMEKELRIEKSGLSDW